MSTKTTAAPLPAFYVGLETTAARIANFTNDKHGILSTALGKADTKSVWYSREHFAKLLEEIDLAEGDGIRVYFGAYEEGHEYEGQLCLLFTSTRENMVGSSVFHTNVILEHELDYPERSAQERYFIPFPGDNPTEQDEKDFNYGQPCPPRCDGGIGDPPTFP